MFFFFQAEDGIRDKLVTGVQTCALPIYRFGRLDFDEAEQLAALLRGLKDEVGIPGWRPSDGRRLFVARIDGNLELSLVFRPQQANHAVVLELLADGPHENRAQHNLRREYMRVQGRRKTGRSGLNVAQAIRCTLTPLPRSPTMGRVPSDDSASAARV